MSSPFQKSFSAKSPITTSPLAAGGYASGVDGMRYVSPKQPAFNTPKAKKPKEDKTPEKEKIKPMEKTIETKIVTPETKITTEGFPSEEKIITFRSDSNERLTYKEAWKRDLEGVRSKYKDYKSYVADRTGQKKADSKGYQADLIKKTGRENIGASAAIFYDKHDGKGEQIWGGIFNKN